MRLLCAATWRHRQVARHLLPKLLHPDPSRRPRPGLLHAPATVVPAPHAAAPPGVSVAATAARPTIAAPTIVGVIVIAPAAVLP